MKLVSLMPVRNEEWVLRVSAEIALQWCDELVILAHASTDGSSKIIEELHGQYPKRVWSLRVVESSWDEMQHRQLMLECARRVGATHIALVDADEILTGNLCPIGEVETARGATNHRPLIRDYIANLEPGQILQLPLYNLRGSLNHYHQTGIWGNRIVSVVFVDDPKLSWTGNQFHHREPMGLDLVPVRPIEQGQGGIMHLWGAGLRRLAAKHALYKMTERVRWPSKPVAEIEALYNLWRGPTRGDPAWKITGVDPAWWSSYEHLMPEIQLDEVPWQEAECRQLHKQYGAFMFHGLDLFGCAEDAKPKPLGPVFSLCHTTARLEGWQKAAQTWLAKCDHPETVEYILSVDEASDTSSLSDQLPTFGKRQVVVNTKRPCSVDGWNKAAQVSTGRFLINVADDLMPCEHWDTELLRAIPNLNQDCVLDVDTGGLAGLLPFCFLTRKYLEKLTDRYGYEGGFFFPGYRGMYSDTEFTDLVRRDGVLVNARHLFFEHQHPIFGKVPMDAVYLRQNSKSEYDIGKQVYDDRMQQLGMTGIANKDFRYNITVALPGENFSREWVASWTELLGKLMQQWNVLPVFSYCTNVYVNRACIWQSIKAYPVQPHLILWIDDDNPVTSEQVNRLIMDMNEHPEADVIAGWCWINRGLNGDKWGTSCGWFDSDGVPHAYTHEELMSGDSDVKAVEFTGFPVVLMRRELLDKLGDKPFRPFLSDALPFGFSGEDVSFCKAAKASGARLFVDRRVKVRHLKLGDSAPVVLPTGELELELARTAGN